MKLIDKYFSAWNAKTGVGPDWPAEELCSRGERCGGMSQSASSGQITNASEELYSSPCRYLANMVDASSDTRRNRVPCGTQRRLAGRREHRRYMAFHGKNIVNELHRPPRLNVAEMTMAMVPGPRNASGNTHTCSSVTVFSVCSTSPMVVLLAVRMSFEEQFVHRELDDRLLVVERPFFFFINDLQFGLEQAGDRNAGTVRTR